MFITTSFKLVVNKKEKEQILKLMRSFSSAVRFSYKRLLECFTPSQAYTITRQKFPELNSHYEGRWEGVASRLGPDGFAGPP
jgi:hypothetical protein